MVNDQQKEVVESVLTKVCSNKKCSFGGREQLLDAFSKDKTKKDGFSFWCKICMNQYNKEYRQSHKEQAKKYNKEYRDIHKEKSLRYGRQYNELHKEEKKQRDKRYRENCRQELNEKRNEYAKNRRKQDPQYKIVRNLRKRLWEALKNNIKVGSAVADLMMSISDFKLYLEERFYRNPETGEMMTWNNYGVFGWHIDHIVPLSAFDLTNREELLKACHYSNLRPMWAKQNIVEGDRGLSRKKAA